MKLSTAFITYFAVISLILALMSQSALAQQRKTKQEIEDGFTRDGYHNFRWAEYQGQRACEAVSKTATVKSTGEYKKVYYTEGNPYQMGYLLGLLQVEALQQMSRVFVDNILPYWLAQKWAQKFKKYPIYTKILDSLINLLAKGAVPSFDAQDIPQHLLDEMKGLVDGAASVTTGTNWVTRDRLIVMNYGIDYLLSHIYTGKLGARMIEQLDPNDPEFHKTAKYIEKEWMNFITLGSFCNSMTVGKNATTTGHTYFLRDFQFPTGSIFQNLAVLTIYNPSSDSGLIAHTTGAAPGFFGAMGGLNKYGLAMGVDMLPSGANSNTVPGLNSLLMVRYILANARNTKEAINLVVKAKRGITWLYPISDPDHYVVLEAHMSMPDDFDPLSVVRSDVLGYLPKLEEIRQHDNVPNQGGIFVRESDYVWPTYFNKFNPDLMTKYNKLPYNESSFLDKQGYIYQPWNSPWYEILENNYFPPQRETFDDVIIVTNCAFIPASRVLQMARVPDYLAISSDHLQWRYDKLNDMVMQKYGKIDWDTFEWLGQFLFPHRTPGYWHYYLDESDPTTAVIEGLIFFADLQELRVRSYTGYYCDKPIDLHLGYYV